MVAAKIWAVRERVNDIKISIGVILESSFMCK